MKLSIVLAAGSAVLSGCAAILAADCGSDPYEVGRRDGIADRPTPPR